ncbi:MAG TPA: hypothetical protein VM223_04335 [Planctomycetota bacterium]|nr:hypothetical protein [Planctomycetota bacterium]
MSNRLLQRAVLAALASIIISASLAAQEATGPIDMNKARTLRQKELRNEK